MKPDFDPIAAANAEIGWWKAHHEKNYEKVIEQMTNLYQILFQLDAKTAEKIVMLRIRAAQEHDLAEKEDISKTKSEEHWRNARHLLIKHFTMLKKAMLKEMLKNALSKAE